MKKITQKERELYIETAKILKGAERRVFMARVVELLGWGGQSFVEKELNWSRETLTKGKHELSSGIHIIDNFSARGAKRIEEKLPHLLDDIKYIVDGESQTDPTFNTTRLYTRLTSKSVREQLIEQKNYTNEELPTEETIRKKLNELGYHVKNVQKTKPKEGKHINLPN